MAAGGRHFEKKNGKSPLLSHYLSYLHQIWYAGRHGQPATSPYITFGLQQNPGVIYFYLDEHEQTMFSDKQ